MLKEELELAAQVMGQDDELLSERLYALGRLLRDRGYVRPEERERKKGAFRERAGEIICLTQPWQRRLFCIA